MKYICTACQEPMDWEEFNSHSCPRLTKPQEETMPATQEAPVPTPAVYSKATSPNPKDIVGSQKISISKLPPVSIFHAAMAMMNGAEKYGAYNWRAKNIQAGIYVDAALRHLFEWFEGEEIAKDSGVHHLGHAMACCAILLDAQENGNLIDDRPICGNPEIATRVLDKLANAIKKRKETK